MIQRDRRILLTAERVKHAVSQQTGHHLAVGRRELIALEIRDKVGARLASKLLDKRDRLAVLNPATKITERQVEVAAKIEGQRGLVLLYESEEPPDSPSVAPAAFVN